MYKRSTHTLTRTQMHTQATTASGNTITAAAALALHTSRWLMVKSAPSSRHAAMLSGLLAVAMTVRPRSFLASWMTKLPTPPAPGTTSRDLPAMEKSKARRPRLSNSPSQAVSCGSHT